MQDRGAHRLLHMLKATGPQTAAHLAEKLGVTAVAIRQMVERMEADGLVAFEDIRLTVGRPKRHWRLTQAGHARFPDSHAGLTLELIEATEAVFGEEGLHRLIAHREERILAHYLAQLEPLPSLADKVERLAALRSLEGYMASAITQDDALYLIENHCPICAAATQCKAFCRSELAIFQAALGPDAKIERTDHIIGGASRCAYLISQA